MRDVGKERHLGLHTLGYFQRLLHTQVRRVRFRSQRVDHQSLYARDLLRDRLRHRATIAQIRQQFLARARKEVAIHDVVSVRHGQRRDQGLAQLKRSIHYVRLRFQITGKWAHRLEGKLEDALQIRHRFARRVNRHAPAFPTEAPQIVEPHDVIRVRMREHDCVHPADIFAQGLRAKIRARVHHPRAFRRLEVNGRTQPLVPRIRRSADGAVAPDHGHALRSARPEKRDLELSGII